MLLPMQFDRRSFLRVTAASGLALTCGMPLPAHGADKITRTGKPHLKLSMAAYSYRQWLTGDKSPRMTLDEFIQKCADFGLDGCELTSYYFPKDFKDDYLIHLKELCFRLGLDVSGTAIGNDFCHPPGPERDATLAHTQRWIDNSALFGAPVIRIFAGNKTATMEEAAAIELCAAGINSSLEYAAQKGVFLALENHGGITSTPAQMLKIIEAVKPSPWFGVNFDSGNFRTDDPYRDLAEIAPYAVNAQIKTDIQRSGKREDSDLERVIKILTDAGYRGYIVLEYEGAESAETAVPKHLATLRQIIDKVNAG